MVAENKRPLNTLPQVITNRKAESECDNMRLTNSAMPQVKLMPIIPPNKLNTTASVKKLINIKPLRAPSAF